MTDYEIKIGQHRLSLGTRIVTPTLDDGQPVDGSRWDMAPGIYSVDGLVNTLDLLFEAVVCRLGEAADRESLLDGLEASISNRRQRVRAATRCLHLFRCGAGGDFGTGEEHRRRFGC